LLIVEGDYVHTNEAFPVPKTITVVVGSRAVTPIIAHLIGKSASLVDIRQEIEGYPRVLCMRAVENILAEIIKVKLIVIGVLEK
jgi:hypothetical protein